MQHTGEYYKWGSDVTMAQQDVCARCCKPLGLSEARFNKRFWGMAHVKCAAGKVWPPRGVAPNPCATRALRPNVQRITHSASFTRCLATHGTTISTGSNGTV